MCARRSIEGNASQGTRSRITICGRDHGYRGNRCRHTLALYTLILSGEAMSGRRVDSFAEDIEELKRKIALLGTMLIYHTTRVIFITLVFSDGDKKAYYENTQWEMQRNRAKIQQLRDENKLLRDKLSRKVAVST